MVTLQVVRRVLIESADSKPDKRAVEVTFRPNNGEKAFFENSCSGGKDYTLILPFSEYDKYPIGKTFTLTE